jgi:hypothetical protein
MRHLIKLVISLGLAIVLGVASDFAGEQQRVSTNSAARAQVTSYHLELAKNDPNKITEIDSDLQKRVGKDCKLERIANGQYGLSLKAVKALRENGLNVNYIPYVVKDPTGYAGTNWIRLLIFFAVTLPVIYLSDLVVKFKPCFFHVPVRQLRYQVAVTLSEILDKHTLLSDTLLADRLSSPHKSFIDNTLIGNIKVFDNGTSAVGLVLVRNNCEYNTYASIAIELDKCAKESIKSTNVSLPSDLFGDENTRNLVVRHLETGNERAHRYVNGIKVVRRQINMSVDSESLFHSEYNSTEQYANDYRMYYEDGSKRKVDFRKLLLGKDIAWEDFLGDYIIYDNKVILKYDSTTHQLSLMIGENIIAQHSSVFRK